MSIAALIEAVEAGTIPRHDLDAFIPAFGLTTEANNALDAYKGSLDAAMALHDALLPGWVAKPVCGGAGAGVTKWHCEIEEWDTGDTFSGDNQPSPARAWLLAILRAKEAGQ